MLVSDSMTARQATFLADDNYAKRPPNERITRSGTSAEIDELKNIGSPVQYLVRLGSSCRMVHFSGGVPSACTVIN